MLSTYSLLALFPGPSFALSLSFEPRETVFLVTRINKRDLDFFSFGSSSADTEADSVWGVENEEEAEVDKDVGGVTARDAMERGEEVVREEDEEDLEEVIV